jgi:hypothetical protein
MEKFIRERTSSAALIPCGTCLPATHILSMGCSFARCEQPLNTVAATRKIAVLKKGTKAQRHKGTKQG